jgi:hypothetical protein
VPKGHCWVEGDNGEISLDSKSFGPVSALCFHSFEYLKFPFQLRACNLCSGFSRFCSCSFHDICSRPIDLNLKVFSVDMMQIPLGLMKGKVTHVLWPPHRFGPVQSHLPEGRVLSQKSGTRTYP